MNIFEVIESSNNPVSYKEINYNSHLLPLACRDYGFIYSELKFNNTFQFVDQSNNLNFIVKVDAGFNIENIIKNRKFLYITRDIDGPIIELNIENIDKKLIFKFNLDDTRQIHNLRNLFELRKTYVHFLMEISKQYIKSYSFTIEFEPNMIEKIKYMISYSYYGCRPRLELDWNLDQDTYFLSFSYDEKILEELLEIIDKLQKWGSKDTFVIYIENKDNLVLNFSGAINNYGYFKSELIKKFTLIDEGKKELSGKPFILYNAGLTYFLINSSQTKG